MDIVLQARSIRFSRPNALMESLLFSNQIVNSTDNDRPFSLK